MFSVSEYLGNLRYVILDIHLWHRGESMTMKSLMYAR